MKKGLNKKGSHVGLVLSFVIFVTFVIFLYSILEPALQTNRDQQTFLKSLRNSLAEKFSDNLTTEVISILDSYSTDEKCILIPFVPGTEDMNVVVKDEHNNIINSAKISSGVNIEWAGEKFFKLLYLNTSMKSSEFNLRNCSPLSESNGNYSIGFMRTNKYIFQSKILDFITLYKENYDEVKKSLGVPLGSEFEFSFINSSGDVTGTSQKNVSVSVYAEETPIQYVNSTGDISSGYLNIKVWG